MAAVASPPAPAKKQPEPTQVPWTRKQEEAIKALVESGDKAPWKLGDAALEAVPMGEARGVKTGGQKFTRLLAARVGLEFDTLERTRRVSHAWPDRFRNLSATYGAHQAYTEGGPEQAGERARLFKRLEKDALHGKVTAAAVRKERAKEMGANYRSRTPEEHLLGLCDHVRKLAGPFRDNITRHLLDAQIDQGWRKRNLDQVRDRAGQLRLAADLLDYIVDGEELPTKDEIREQLDPKAW